MTAACPGTDDERVQSALERERTRLADVLHDGALQDLATARQNWSEAREGDREALVALRDDLERLSEQLRTLTTGLHEESLAELPLDQALERIVRGICLRGTPEVAVVVGPGVDPGHGAFVRQVVRELVANVARHAGAGTAEVRVERTGEDLRIRVLDDGRGIDPAAAAAARAAGHLGLARIRRAVGRRGGTFEIVARPTGGSLATVSIPA